MDERVERMMLAQENPFLSDIDMKIASASTDYTDEMLNLSHQRLMMMGEEDSDLSDRDGEPTAGGVGGGLAAPKRKAEKAKWSPEEVKINRPLHNLFLSSLLILLSSSRMTNSVRQSLHSMGKIGNLWRIISPERLKCNVFIAGQKSSILT